MPPLELGLPELRHVQLPADAHAVWSHRPLVEDGVALTVCATDPACAAAALMGATAAAHRTDGTNGTVALTAPRHCAVTAHFWLPAGSVIPSIERLVDPTRTVARQGVSIVDECTDGADSDGDGLADTLDPGCALGSRLRESGEPRGRASHAFSWTLANDTADGNTYIQSLIWTDRAGTAHSVVKQQAGARDAADIVYFPHSNTGNTTWYANGWSFKTYTRGDAQAHAVPGQQTTSLEETSDDIRVSVTDSSDDSIAFLSETNHARITNQMRFTGDVPTPGNV